MPNYQDQQQDDQPQAPTTPRGATIQEPTIELVDRIRFENRQQETNDASQQNNITPIPLNFE